MGEKLETVLIVLSFVFLIITAPLSIWFCFRVLREYERAVIFRLGRLMHPARGPGLVLILPCTDNFVVIDLRVVTLMIPTQEVLTKDSVTVRVDACVYFKVDDPILSYLKIKDYAAATNLLSATSLRDQLGTLDLTQVLSDREAISLTLQVILDEATRPWGVVVQRVEIKDVSLPSSMQRVMAAEGEAIREAKAKVIAAQGEFDAAMSLKDASDIISSNPAALQLRYLQTLNTISVEQNKTIVFPLPLDILSWFVPKFAQCGNILHQSDSNTAMQKSPQAKELQESLPTANLKPLATSNRIGESRKFEDTGNQKLFSAVQESLPTEDLKPLAESNLIGDSYNIEESEDKNVLSAVQETEDLKPVTISLPSNIIDDDKKLDESVNIKLLSAVQECLPTEDLKPLTTSLPSNFIDDDKKLDNSAIQKITVTCECSINRCAALCQKHLGDSASKKITKICKCTERRCAANLCVTTPMKLSIEPQELVLKESQKPIKLVPVATSKVEPLSGFYIGKTPVENLFTMLPSQPVEEVSSSAEEDTLNAKKLEARIEEPSIGEPSIEEPVVEEPIVKVQIVEEPIVEEPIVEEPIVEKPIVEEPIVKEPIVEEPIVEEPIVEEPIIEDIIVQEPTVQEPISAPPTEVSTSRMSEDGSPCPLHCMRPFSQNCPLLSSHETILLNPTEEESRKKKKKKHDCTACKVSKK